MRLQRVGGLLGPYGNLFVHCHRAITYPFNELNNPLLISLNLGVSTAGLAVAYIGLGLHLVVRTGAGGWLSCRAILCRHCATNRPAQTSWSSAPSRPERRFELTVALLLYGWYVDEQTCR